MHRINPGILPRCPVKDLVSDYPCPGYYKHNPLVSSLPNRTPCGKGEALCSLGIFVDMHCRHTQAPLHINCGDAAETNNIRGNIITNLDQLLKLLHTMSSKKVNAALQLGGLFDSSLLKCTHEPEALFSALKRAFEGHPMKILHSMGDQETAVRSDYMKSFLAKSMKEYGLIREPLRCCGSAYYSERIGQESMLIVLDGYDLLAADVSGKQTGGGLKFERTEVACVQTKCSECNRGNPKPVGWGTEFRTEHGYFTNADFRLLPPIHYALSEPQLHWLNLQLQEATRRTDNVVIACHAPLHPLLVTDRSALPLNWKEVLRLIMSFNCVRLVLSGRPANEAAQPPTPEKPYQLDHGILYYSVPPASDSVIGETCPAHMVVELGYDFIRIKGEGIHLPADCQKSEWTIPFEPRRKLRMNHFDYAFNGGYDY
ncbi:Manganese-dependent ADP-ribose/CDP-alcohol diphosphatase [Clonorchis sinensis]|uniref:Manganese-dependent ADP-ribose/CDP-alcohol diphosphatase n=1 Tax=Clonorchis sinensis TaxID=79923 RepID=A0A8T1M0L2_CLOSI|nr:Manganese-dependent ADP-ribose/CDP-alcohol diphosphatase [Clonorchis sinensis]